MYIPVHLNNQRRRMAVEVHDVAVDDLLAPEMQTTEAVAFQMPPNRLFGGCLVVSQVTGLDTLEAGMSARDDPAIVDSSLVQRRPTPNPSLKGGELTARLGHEP
jgi:hypothetical protein